MKKIFAVVLTLVMMVAFTACGGVLGKKKEITPTLSDSFVCAVKMTYGDIDSEAEITRYGSNLWDAEFATPSALAGVKMSFVNGDVTTSYKGLTFSVPQSALPVKSMLTCLFDVIDEITAKDKIEAAEDGDGFVIEGKMDQGDYTIKIDKNGVIKSFEMPNLELVIEFSNFSVSAPQMDTSMTGETSATDTAAAEGANAQVPAEDVNADGQAIDANAQVSTESTAEQPAA